VSGAEWTVLTRRTSAPKLTWLLRALEAAGVQGRLNGDAFLAPVMEVHQADFARAWDLLAPVDDLPDDDPTFGPSRTARAWWLDQADPVLVGVTGGALGLLANKARRAFAATAGCIPAGASAYTCPLAGGVIESCPASLWPACRPLVRLETFGLALATHLGADDSDTIRRCGEVYREVVAWAKDAEVPVPITVTVLCHVVAREIGDDWIERLAPLPAVQVVRTVMRETVKVNGTVVPRRPERDFSDLAQRGLNLN